MLEWLAPLVLIGLAGFAWQRRAVGIARKRDLAANGTRTRATITHKRARRRPRGPPLHYAGYRYRADDGREYQGTARLTAQEAIELEQGDPIEIVYDPRAPTFSRTAAYLRRRGWSVED